MNNERMNGLSECRSQLAGAKVQYLSFPRRWSVVATL